MEEAGEEKIAGESGGVADGQKRVEQAGERVEEMWSGKSGESSESARERRGEERRRQASSLTEL